MQIGIVGLGLIGGSLALSLKKREFAVHIIGVDNNKNNAQQALQLGLVDEISAIENILSETDLVILALPVDAAKTMLPILLQKCSPHQIIVDMGSTKGGICEIADKQPNRANFVAAHPIAGTENAGPTAAFDGLYDNKVTIICDKDKSNPKAVATCEQMFRILKMKIQYMDAHEHDRHIAYVSHLSHITSFVLGQTVLEIEKDEKNIFNMAGSGFASTVRLAKSSPDMWAPIFEQNQNHLSTALDAYIKNLSEFKRKIDSGDKEGLKELMLKVNDIRRVLDGI